MGKTFFLTVDAETEVMAQGIKIISEVREEVERQMKIKIPIVWFIRFQREWTEYIQNDSVENFKKPILNGFDGFEIAQSQLLSLIRRGDEIGWHYHAYNYVERDDLDHATKSEILKADLASCASAIKQRHSCFDIRAFRFGWFFVPDYQIYHTLKENGIKADASINPDHTGKVRPFNVNFLPPITLIIKQINGICFFPFSNTKLIHDYNVVPHAFRWDNLDNEGAIRERNKFKETLLQIATELEKKNGSFLTYQAFLQGSLKR